ncbi:MAG: hypothetical protein V4582_01615 [Pseudomonadota bacterium]
MEAGFALFLLVFIVWWTMYSVPKQPPSEQEDAPAPEAARDESPDAPKH